MSTKPLESLQELEAIRGKIDAADQRLHAALVERMEYVRALAEVKKAGGARLAFRPGREAQLIRKRVAMGGVDPIMLTHIWRQIIAAALSLQQEVSFGLLTGSNPAELASAQAWCGANNSITVYRRAQDLLTQMAQNPTMVGLVPCDAPAPWWQTMEAATHIVARWPYIESDPACRLYILANMPPEPSDDDWTVLAQADRITTRQGWLTPDQLSAREKFLGCFATPIDQ